MQNTNSGNVDENLDWDERLNARLTYSWKQIEQTLPYITKIEVPRFVGESPQTKFDIHILHMPRNWLMVVVST